jgi:hypothetical protein
LLASGGRLRLVYYVMRPLQSRGPLFTLALDSEDGAHWQQVHKLGLPAIRPRSMVAYETGGRLFVFVSDRGLGTLVASVVDEPRPPASPGAETR